MNRFHFLIISALILRLVVALLGHHPDVVNYFYWSKYLLNHGLYGFYDATIDNAMRPTYPPVTSYIFWLTGLLHQLIWQVSWFLNIHISLFPSGFINWLESPYSWYFINKLPAIFADIGIIWLLKKYFSTFAASLFAFLPPFWYSSALWGQTDSIYAIFLLAAFIALARRRLYLSVFLYLFAVLTKPTAFFALPAFALWWLRLSQPKHVFISVCFSLTLLLLSYYPFHPQNVIPWIVTFYLHSLGGELNQIVANSFNFWGLVYGFSYTPGTARFLILPANIIGYIIYTISSIILIIKLLKTRILYSYLLFISGAVFSFLAFSFLPLMHERYFYPVLLLLIPPAAKYPSFRFLFYLLSLFHLLNLYHLWWVPRIGFFITLLSQRPIEQFLILIQFLVFISLLRLTRSYKF